jgi:hypothetical protein
VYPSRAGLEVPGPAERSAVAAAPVALKPSVEPKEFMEMNEGAWIFGKLGILKLGLSGRLSLMA